MARKQAQAGGENGINGEWYDGGQFLPGSENTVKGLYKIKAGTKSQIAPYTWGKSPANDVLSIYDRIQYRVIDNRKECEYVKGTGFVGLKLEMSSLTREHKILTSYGIMEISQNEYEWIAGMIEKFNAGERWIPLADDPTHYLNRKAS